MKFNPTFTAVITRDNPPIRHALSFPLTCEFDVTYRQYAQANVGNFVFYGLGDTARRDIYFDRYVNDMTFNIVFSAGYPSEMKTPQIFRGYIQTAFTQRRGPELVTSINALDNGNAYVLGLVPADFKYNKDPNATTWQFTDVVTRLIELMPDAEVGRIKITGLQETQTRMRADQGRNIWEVLQELRPTGATLYSQAGKVFMLGKDDSVQTESVPVITPRTGLLGIPMRHGRTVTVHCLFDPRFQLGSLAEIRGSSNEYANDMFTVKEIHHYGTISGVQSPGVFTDLTLLSTTPDSIQAGASTADNAGIV